MLAPQAPGLSQRLAQLLQQFSNCSAAQASARQLPAGRLHPVSSRLLKLHRKDLLPAHSRHGRRNNGPSDIPILGPMTALPYVALGTW